jgi:hypothetical protein
MTSQAASIAQRMAGSGAARLVLRQAFSTATGNGVVQGTTTAISTFGAQIVLVRDAAAALGYYILTGYPIP